MYALACACMCRCSPLSSVIPGLETPLINAPGVECDIIFGAIRASSSQFHVQQIQLSGTVAVPKVTIRTRMRILCHPPPSPMFIPATHAQVLHETWSVIVAVCPDGSSVSVSPFQGMENPPHMGDRRLDSRCLYYDPRGWWNHVHALRQQNNVPAAIGRDLMRLYRPYRGISASGLQSGTGCLNVPLLICGPEDELPESRCRAGVDINPQTVPSSCRLDAKGLPGDADSVPSNRHSRSPPSSHCHAGPFSGRCGAPRPLNVFRAECCWDPVFVVAPARLVGLQNQAAAREMGLKRARLAAWQHIDGPEASERNGVRARRGSRCSSNRSVGTIR